MLSYNPKYNSLLSTIQFRDIACLIRRGAVRILKFFLKMTSLFLLHHFLHNKLVYSVYADFVKCKQLFTNN